VHELSPLVLMLLSTVVNILARSVYINVFLALVEYLFLFSTNSIVLPGQLCPEHLQHRPLSAPPPQAGRVRGRDGQRACAGRRPAARHCGCCRGSRPGRHCRRYPCTRSELGRHQVSVFSPLGCMFAGVPSNFHSSLETAADANISHW
jgi:hypothetical protein